MERFDNRKSQRSREIVDQGYSNETHHLNYNKEKNSFEYDVRSDDRDYDHPLPYDTAAAGGMDENSDYDEANPYVGDEYNRREQLENEFENLAMHIDSKGESVDLSVEDRFLARTPEDDREDLDEEGYPVSDMPKRVRIRNGEPEIGNRDQEIGNRE